MFNHKTPEEIELAKAQLERINKITSEWFRDKDIKEEEFKKILKNKRNKK